MCSFAVVLFVLPLEELDDLMEEAGGDGRGFQWQLVGVLISWSSQKMIVKEAKEIKVSFIEWSGTVCLAKAQEVRERPEDSVGSQPACFQTAINQLH